MNEKLAVMAGRATRTLEAIAPDGTVLTLRTSGGYDLAGLTKSRYSGEWKIAVKGSSAASVGSRTASQARRDRAASWAVVPLRDPAFRVPQVIQDYFREDAKRFLSPKPVPQVTSAFIPGRGWVPLEREVPAVPRYLRILKGMGAVQVAVSCYGRVPDFTVAELLAVSTAPLLGGSLIGSRTK